MPVGAQHRDLSSRPRVVRPNQQEPQPCFLRRLGTGIYQLERRPELRESTGTGMLEGQLNHVVRRDPGRSGKGVETRNGSTEFPASADVECGALRRRYVKAGDADSPLCA
ncbi:MAG TPA: hypothetical protein VET27_00250 [Mycobacterium sp.]|nr:hypothetical protein [Mycobacterium sp.]